MTAPKGTKPFMNPKARKLDKLVKTASKNVFESLKLRHPGLEYKVKLDTSEVPGGIGSCEPDGGIWIYLGKIIASMEGKKQDEEGNAGQRWYQNMLILRELSSDLTYVTFGIGKSAKLVYINKDGNTKKDGSPYHAGLMWDLHFAHCEHRGVINEMKLGVNNYYPKPDGFTIEEIESIIEKTIIASIEK